MLGLTSLLIRPKYPGFPSGYLLARLCGRRSRLPDGRFPLAIGSESGAAAAGTRPPAGAESDAVDPWGRMRREFIWLYHQMNDGLRKTFAPLFLWFELPTILIALRYQRGGERERGSRILSTSLLSDRIKEVLTSGKEPPPLLDALAAELEPLLGPPPPLGDIFRHEGGETAEEQLTTLALQQLAELPLTPLLHGFFRSVIDMRNLVALSKQQRWRFQAPGAFVRGGSILPERLTRTLLQEERGGILPLVRELPGMGDVGIVPANPEPMLLHWLTRAIRRLGREPLEEGIILDYVWRCSLEARRRSLLDHCAGMPPDKVADETAS